MGLTLSDLLSVFKQMWEKSINIPGHVFSWEMRFRNRETRSRVFFCFKVFLIAFLLLFVYPKQNISCIIYILFLLSPVSQSFHLLILYVKNTSKVTTDQKKEKVILYSFAINRIVYVQFNMRHVGLQSALESEAGPGKTPVLRPTIAHAGKPLARSVAQFWLVPSGSFFPDKVWA